MNVEQYADMFVSNWNRVTADTDMTIFVGDIGKQCPRTIECLRSLKGIKILVIGNHDVCWGQQLYDSSLFQGTHRSIWQQQVFVQHIPLVVDLVGVSYYVHGHHHRYDLPGMQQELLRYSRDVYRLNCAADLIGHTPRTLQELILQKELLLEKYKARGILKEDI
ncbi:MAG: hypothetical protein NC489_30195 [Ruminococcus flavefaciens]|nr:hypothetical protein [Ruminococcus flavefaciens]